jgi:hypothetical protein
MRYTACLDVERQARQAVTAQEKRRDDISWYFDYLRVHSLSSPFKQWAFSCRKISQSVCGSLPLILTIVLLMVNFRTAIKTLVLLGG